MSQVRKGRSWPLSIDGRRSLIVSSLRRIPPVTIRVVFAQLRLLEETLVDRPTLPLAFFKAPPWLS